MKSRNITGGIAIGRSGNVWVAYGRILNPDGTMIGSFEIGSFLGLNHIPRPRWSIAVDGSGNVWVSNPGKLQLNVTKLKQDGTTIGTFAVGDSLPETTKDGSSAVYKMFDTSWDTAVDGSGNV